MNDDDKFFFDLKGFVHLKGVLSQEEVDRCNTAIDAHADRFFQTERTLEGDSKVLGARPSKSGWRACWNGSARTASLFADLLVHAKIRPYLNELLGSGYRLDHGPLLIAMDKGDSGHYLHGGGVERQDFSQTYTFKYGQMFCGLTAVEFQLADEGPRRRRPSSHTRIPQSQLPPAREAVPVRRTPRVRQRDPQPSRRRHYLHRSTDPRHASLAGRTPAPLASLQVQSILPSPTRPATIRRKPPITSST